MWNKDHLLWLKLVDLYFLCNQVYHENKAVSMTIQYDPCFHVENNFVTVKLAETLPHS